MRKHLALLATASLSAGTFAFVGYDNTLLAQMSRDQHGADHRGAGAQAAGQTDLPQGVSRSMQTDSQSIRNTLTETTNAAIKDLSKLPNHLTQSDRQRLSNFAQQDNQRLTKALGNLRAHWKEKYNQEFDIGGKTQVVFGDQFRNFEIVQGEVSNPALLSNWPVGTSEQQQQWQQQQQQQQQRKQQYQQRSQQQGADDSRAATELEMEEEGYHSAGGPGQPQVGLIPGQQQRDQIGQAEEFDEEAMQAGGMQRPGAGVTTLQRGTDVAIATFPPSHGLPETTVSLVRETGIAGRAAQAAGGEQAGNWYIDIPDSVSSNELSTHLANHIEGLNAGRQSWPNDVNEAYRLVSHHVMQAMYETSDK